MLISAFKQTNEQIEMMETKKNNFLEDVCDKLLNSTKQDSEITVKNYTNN